MESTTQWYSTPTIAAEQISWFIILYLVSHGFETYFINVKTYIGLAIYDCNNNCTHISGCADLF